jgi:hypothetical protein
MPGFFDFSGANSPLDQNDQSWGGDLIYGPGSEAPNPVPQDVFGATSLPPSNGIPFNALSAMNGIQMPTMPTQDPMGRYGITPEQQQGASRQGLSSVLMGAANSLFNSDPSHVMNAGAKAGDIQRGALDKASQANIENFKLQVEAKAKELDFLGKKSDIQKQQLVIEQEAMKLEDLKLKRVVAQEWGKEMAPVMSEMIAKAQNMYPDKVDALKRGFLTAQSKLASGDLEGAEAQFNLTIQDLPSEWQKKVHEDMVKTTVHAANKFKIGLETIQNPELQNLAKTLGLTFEMNEKGEPVVISQRELQERQLKDELTRSNITQNYAQADYLRGRNEATAGGKGTKGQLTQAQILKQLAEMNEAAEVLMQDETKLFGPALQKAQNAKMDARGKLESVGVNTQDPKALANFMGMSPNDQAKLIQGAVAPSPGQMPLAGGSNTATQQGGVTAAGAKGLILKAAKSSNPSEMAAAVKAARGSADSNLVKMIDKLFANAKDDTSRVAAFKQLAEIISKNKTQ